jgi:hypothetical protein
MHPMKRAFLIFVFGLGTVGGFAHGFASLHGRGACGGGRYDRRAAFEDHIAEVCTRAANRVNEEDRSHGAAFDARFGANGPAWGPAAPMAAPLAAPLAAPAPVTISGPAVITITAPATTVPAANVAADLAEAQPTE